MANFFIENITVVYFFYGLSFFSMGLAVMLEVGHSSEGNEFAQALRPLAWFGIVHGSHEWFEMFQLIRCAEPSPTIMYLISLARVFILAGSFFLLLTFGLRLIAQQTNPRLIRNVIVLALTVWGTGVAYWLLQRDATHLVAADVYTRYTLALPGGALAAWGLVLQNRRFRSQGMQRFGLDVSIAALAFAMYGIVGQLFASPSEVFPSSLINSQRFLDWFGFPVQVLRAVMACLAAITIIRSLRTFEVENALRIEALHQAQQAERQRLEVLRGELLHRTVQAQESERTRIARELHDEIGQTLTALGMGLRGLAETIGNQPERAVQQARKLENVAVNGLTELQRLVSGLHPPQLDDLGLLAALRWFANDIFQRFGLQVQVTHQGPLPELSPEERTILFRIAQEAITNIVRHAHATSASMQLSSSEDKICVIIEDDGRGFDVQSMLRNEPGRPSWGLMGMMERASLSGGNCEISSEIGKGTRVQACIQRGEQTVHG